MKAHFLFLLSALSLAILVSCQMSPTKVTREEPVLVESITAEKLLQDKPVLLDARPAFEFNLAHVPGAINIRWEDFSQTHPQSRGVLQADLFSVARRLALIGIDPETPVVVLGQGSQGAGEEGRIAWTLRVLGVKKVHTLVHSSYRKMNTSTESPPPVKNKPYWKPVVAEPLMVDAKRFKSAVTQNLKPVVVLDVRSLEEFNLRNLSKDKKVKVPVVNLEWREFFSAQGWPSKASEQRLQEEGVGKDSVILVISNHGVRSGAVTYALDFLGYKNVRNFAGGYEQWK